MPSLNEIVSANWRELNALKAAQAKAAGTMPIFAYDFAHTYPASSTYLLRASVIFTPNDPTQEYFATSLFNSTNSDFVSPSESSPSPRYVFAHVGWSFSGAQMTLSGTVFSTVKGSLSFVSAEVS